MDDQEFSTRPVPADRQVAWWRVGLVSAMVSFSLPTFLTGAEVFLAMDNRDAIWAIVIGCSILASLAALCGAIGTRTHLSSYMLTRIAFGHRGAAVANLAFAISLLGWFGVNIDLFGDAVVRLSRDALGVDMPVWIAEAVAGVLMTMTTIYGFRAINILSMWLVPAMILVTGVFLVSSLGQRDWSATMASTDVSTLSFGHAVSAVVGGVIVGAVIMPDITRFIRGWRGALYTALLSYLVVQVVVMTAGGLAADLQGSGDLLEILLAAGLGWGAFVLVIAGSWVLNALNLYSAGLSVQASIDAPTLKLTLALGVLGTLAAFLNILDRFLDFLFYLSIVFVPVAGVIVVDHFLARPAAYQETYLDEVDAVSPTALMAWAAGSGVALAGAGGWLTVSGIAALDAMVVSASLYLILTRFRRSSV
ncbi:MAG: cytosine permease [Pseudomonadota bacterium]